MSTFTRTSVKPTGFSPRSPVPQTPVMLRSPSSASSSLRTVQPRCTALACRPTARHEPSAASEASEGLGAVSSPSRAGGSSTMWGGRLRNVVGVPELAFRDRLALQRLDRLGIGLARRRSALQAGLVDRRETAGENHFFLDRSHGFPPIIVNRDGPVCSL